MHYKYLFLIWDLFFNFVLTGFVSYFFFLPDYWFITEDIKRYKSKWWDTRWGDMYSEVQNRSFCPGGVWGQAWWLMEAFWFPNVEILWTLFFWISLSFHCMSMNELLISHWWLIQPPSLISSFWKSSSWTESSNPLFVVGFPGNHPPSLGAFWKSPSLHKPSCCGKGLVMNNKTPISPLWLWRVFRNWRQEAKYYNKICSHCPYHSGNSKDFGFCEPGTQDED